jgi:light-harvesting complex I chlorophyll a/b binding protein 1
VATRTPPADHSRGGATFLTWLTRALVLLSRSQPLTVMQSSAVVALALLESVSAFQAPAMKASTKAVGATMFSEGDLGVLPPLGVYDPLGLIETRDMRRYEIMEIKHGRAAMLGFLHVIALKAGIVVPGYLSTSQDLKFADVPTGCFSSLEAVPTAGWLQIMALTCMQEAGTGFASKAQTDDAEAGDIALDSWVRYDDPEVKTFKLNAERQNGRAAMMGITGCLIHELLGVDALYPTGGMGGAAPPSIF